jgi:hypothetical protein
MSTITPATIFTLLVPNAVAALLLVGALSAREPAALRRPEGGAPAEEVERLRERIDVLTQRMSDLEGKLAAAKGLGMANQVKAPFDVVDASGKPILRVVDGTARGLSLFSASGAQVAFVSALPAGGFFKAKSATGFPEVVLGVTSGVGAVILRDADSKARATLGLVNGKPSLEFANENHVGIAAIGQGTTGGGYLQLGNADGDARVDAGVNVKGCGVVRTHPLGNPGVGLVGMPGTFLLGRC